MSNSHEDNFKNQQSVNYSSSSTCNKYVSKIGASILSKYGWKEGKGLGKSEDGNVNVISLENVTDKRGIGATVPVDNQWDNWWDNMYNNLASKINVGRVDVDNDEKSSVNDIHSTSSLHNTGFNTDKTSLDNSSSLRNTLG